MNLRSKSSSDTAFYSLLPNRRANFTANKVMSDTKLILEKLEKLDVISAKIDAVDLKVTNLDVKVTHLDAKVNDVDRRVTKVEEQSQQHDHEIQRFKLATRKAEIAQIISEANSREYNITIGNMPMTEEYEDKETSVEKVQSVLNTVLNIPDVNKIVIKNAHRLPSKNKEGRKPLIFKLSTQMDKDIIWRHLPALVTYNAGRAFKDKVFIDMNNLPAKLARDRAELLDAYKLARNEGKKPRWRFVKDINKNMCDYCYVIGSTYYHPKNDNYNFKMVAPVAGNTYSM